MKAPCALEHQFIEFKSEQPQPLNYEGHPSGTNLGFKNDHPQELSSSGVGHYINSEQRWINHEANEASLSQPLLTTAPSKSHEGSPRAVLTRI